MRGMTSRHHRERALVLAAVGGCLDAAWPVGGGLAHLDWAWILRRVRESSLGARFWSESLRSSRLASAVPTEVRAELEADAHATAAQNARLVHLALEAIAALQVEGIDALPMKGVAVCLVLPRYGATRPMSDVDLLVRPGDLERSVQALARVLPSSKLVRDYDGADRDAERALRDGVESLYTFFADDGAILELHHGLPGVHSAAAARAAFERAHLASIRGRGVLLPSLDDLLGSMCVHVLEHHGAGQRTMLLRHLSDVEELVGAGASAEGAKALYDTGGRDPVARSLRLLDQAKEEAHSSAAPRSVAGLAVDPGTEGRIRYWATNVGARVARVRAALGKYGLRAVLPTRKFMVTMYGPDAAGPKLPLAHLRRWAGILARAIRGQQ